MDMSSWLFPVFFGIVFSRAPDFFIWQTLFVRVYVRTCFFLSGSRSGSGRA